MLVADEVDFGDFGQRPLVNFINQVDAVLITFDHLRLHRRGITPHPFVDVENALHILLHLGRRINGTGTELHFAFEHFVVHFVITVEKTLVDDRVFIHFDSQDITFDVKRNVGKKTGGVKFLKCAVQLFGTDVVTGIYIDIRENGFPFNPLQSVNFDLSDHRGVGRAGRHQAGQ